MSNNFFKKAIEKLSEKEIAFGKCKFKTNFLFLIMILLIAIVVRIFNNNPSVWSFVADEAEYSLRSIYILEHNWHYSEDYLFDHPPLYMYLQSFFFFAFGTEWFVARGFSIFLGVLTVYISYLAGKEFLNEKLGLIFALLFSFQPLILSINRQVLLENLLFLLMLASFLFIIRYEKKKKNSDFVLAVLMFSLAIITKITAIVLIFPLLYYVYSRKLYKTKLILYSTILGIVVIMPIYYLMISQGFIEFHLQKTGGEGYLFGEKNIYFGKLTTIVFFVIWINVGIIPFAYFFAERIKSKAKETSFFSVLFSNDKIRNFTIIWAVFSIVFFSPLSFVVPQYIATIILPFLILLGIILYKNPKLAILVIFSYLIISIGQISIGKFQGPNDAVEYMKKNIKEKDTIIASDSPIFNYYFRKNDVSSANSNNIIEKNATYIILHSRDKAIFFENETLAKFIDNNYILVYITRQKDAITNITDIVYYIYKRMDL